jgi:hypothetical protein
MKPDKTLKVLLVGILLALLANLCKPLLTPPAATAQTKPRPKAIAAIATESITVPSSNGPGRHLVTALIVVFDDGTTKKVTVK